MISRGLVRFANHKHHIPNRPCLLFSLCRRRHPFRGWPPSLRQGTARPRLPPHRAAGRHACRPQRPPGPPPRGRGRGLRTSLASGAGKEAGRGLALLVRRHLAQTPRRISSASPYSASGAVGGRRARTTALATAVCPWCDGAARRRPSRAQEEGAR
ncbi:hypothetical protein BS78_07G087500 [Paspalum vaginatum]|nr:hypothetical protein BS78_07G087500 [Paspalum vaginatum]